jgi:hypothetical protein
MRSSVKRHSHAQQVKAGPRLRIPKKVRAARAHARHTSNTRWLAAFLGVPAWTLPEWREASPRRERPADNSAGSARHGGTERSP